MYLNRVEVFDCKHALRGVSTRQLVLLLLLEEVVVLHIDLLTIFIKAVDVAWLWCLLTVLHNLILAGTSWFLLHKGTAPHRLAD